MQCPLLDSTINVRTTAQKAEIDYIVSAKMCIVIARLKPASQCSERLLI